METETSSTDEKTPASGKRAVDGSFETCFVSLTHSKPWFVVHLKRYHPIALVQVSRRKTNLTEGIKVSVGNNAHQIIKISWGGGGATKITLT